jgi:hypothetical protein
MVAAADAEDDTAADLPDPSKTYAATRKLSTNLLSRTAVLPLGAAALLPLVAAGATQLPFKDLLKIARSLLLF